MKPLLLYSWLVCFALAAAAPRAVACSVLRVLAGLQSPAERVDRFVDLYRDAIGAARAHRPLSRLENEALLADPFALPESEAGREEIRRVLSSFRDALDRLDENERRQILTELSAWLSHESTAREGDGKKREAERATRFTPPAETDILLETPKDRWPSLVLLPGAKEGYVGRDYVVFDPPGNEPRVSGEGFHQILPYPDGEWKLVQEVPDGMPRFEPLRPGKAPKTPKPFPEEDFIGKIDHVEIGASGKALIFRYQLQYKNAGVPHGYYWAKGQKPLPITSKKSGIAFDLLLMPDEKRVGLFGYDENVRVIDPTTGVEVEWPIRPQTGDVYISRSADGKNYDFVYEDRKTARGKVLVTVDPETGDVVRDITLGNEVGNGIFNLDLSPQPYWISTSGDGPRSDLYLISKITGKRVASAKINGNSFRLSASPEGDKFGIVLHADDTHSRILTFDIGKWIDAVRWEVR